MTPRLRPLELADALGGLEVRIDSARVERQDVELADYPGGPRPSSLVRVGGSGHFGVGENVAFLHADQLRFETYVDAWLRAHEGRSPPRVRDALGAGGTPYERAALEAALIDLALCQAGLSLYDLSGIRTSAVRFVVSLAAGPEPGSAVSALRAARVSAELKLDVDPAWSPDVLAAVARDASIAIFDFKGRADAALANALAAQNARALFEDPPAGFADPQHGAAPSRISRDMSLTDASAVASALSRGEAVNLKAPRMGGPLELLRGLAYGRARAYLGGMFEVSVGRSQARQLAALYCADAPNDLALNTPLPSGERAPENSPAHVSLDQLGFGAPEL